MKFILIPRRLQTVFAPIQDRSANTPTRDDFKDYLSKVEEDLMKRLTENVVCQGAKIKQLLERVDWLASYE